MVVCSVRVSNELGMGHPRGARYSVYTTILQSVVIGIVCMIVILGTRNHFSAIFSDSEEMRVAVAGLSPLLGITMLLNSVQSVISGVAIGGGWQALVAAINLASYYAFGLPLGYLLGYAANLGVVVNIYTFHFIIFCQINSTIVIVIVIVCRDCGGA